MVQASPVLNPNTQQPPTFPSFDAKRRHRQEHLAAAFRVFARAGLVQGLAGHISARDPELTDHFWINPLGVHFSRIRVSDLLLVNRCGEVVKGERSVGKAAFVIHSQIHEARPDIVAAAHTHSLYGKTWSTLGRLLAEAAGKPIPIDHEIALQNRQLGGTHQAGWRGFQHLWEEITSEQPDLLN